MINIYDFTGQLPITTRSHKLNTWEMNNNLTRTLIARNDYDELGNLLHKKLHSTNNGGSFLQTITYHYNSQGWLTRA